MTKARHPGERKGAFMSASPFRTVPTFHTPGLAREVLLQQRAHFMRFHPTPSEAALWRCLRARQLGIVFRRQVIVGQAIVDFCAPAASLIVEVDGDLYHQKRTSADAARERKLIRAGYTVLRIPASLVERDLAAATALVQQALR
jgi:very-short-patch-repair endonuclease